MELIQSQLLHIPYMFTNQPTYILNISRTFKEILVTNDSAENIKHLTDTQKYVYIWNQLIV